MQGFLLLVELTSKLLNDLKIESNIIFDLINLIERDEDVPLEFLYPFSKNISTLTELNYPIIVSNPIQFETIYKKTHDDFFNKIHNQSINQFKIIHGIIKHSITQYNMSDNLSIKYLIVL